MRHIMFHAYAAIQLGGCKASPFNRVESKVMTAAKQHILVRGKSQKNPLPDNAATLCDVPSAGSLGEPEMYSH